MPEPHVPTTVIWENGTVWLGPETPPTDALLARDGIIVAIGSDDVAAALAEAATPDLTRIDLSGGFLMPSFGDGHAHPMFGGLEAEGPRVRECGSIPEIVAEVRRWADAHPDAEWIHGASYDGSLSEGGLFDAHWLDEAVPDRPVSLRAWDYHTVWCNSLALELAGITADTPEPELGEIPRRLDGAPLGVLREWGAVDLLDRARPPRAEPERLRALARAVDYYASHGVTWVQDAWVEPPDVDTYLEAAAQGLLGIRFNLAFYADPRRFADSRAETLAWMTESRDRITALGSDRLTAHTVKFFADGVIENETGAVLEPYCTGMHDHGLQVWGDDSLAEAVRAVDAAGFQVHIHAIGDAAVRQALDAIEAAIETNGPRDRRPVIAHAQLIDPADLPRFSRLGVIAMMQPLWAQLDDLMTVLTIPRLGRERADRQYQLRSLLDDGARVAFGSDWPCSSGVPVEGLAIATSRTTEDGDPDGGWNPAEIIDLDRGLAAYTSAVAHQAFAGADPHPDEQTPPGSTSPATASTVAADRASAGWGTIRLGASADLIELDVDPRTLTARGLSRTRIRRTHLGGVCIYDAEVHEAEAHDAEADDTN